MSLITKKIVPLLITIICFVIVIFDYFLTIPVFQIVSKELQSWSILIGAFAVYLGIITSIRHYGHVIIKREKDKYFSVWGLFCLILFFITGLGFGRSQQVFQWIFNNVYTPLDTTLISLLAIYITYASFRAFRCRNRETLLFLIVGFLVIIGNIPMSSAIWVGFGLNRDWIMSVPVAAITRVIKIGSTLGMITIVYRILVGTETGYLGRKEE